MRSGWLVFLSLILSGVFPGVAGAALHTIGTASYHNASYDLIYDESQELVWLDYTNPAGTWQSQVDWTSGLGGSLDVTLAPGYTADLDWDSWRLPASVAAPRGFGFDGTSTTGYNITTSEMGHLFYASLGNNAFFDPSGDYAGDGNYGLQNTGPFSNLTNGPGFYWSGTEEYVFPFAYAYNFFPSQGYQSFASKGEDGVGVAVHPGQVTMAPIPLPALLLGSGLIGMAVLRRKFKG